MTDAAASWHPDPTGRHDHRYWDGSAWTEHVADAGVAATDPYHGSAPPPEVPAVTLVDTAAEPTAPVDATTELPTSELPSSDAATSEVPTTDDATAELPTSEAATELPTSEATAGVGPSEETAGGGDPGAAAVPPIVPPLDGSPEHPAGGNGSGSGTNRLVVGIAIVAVLALVGAGVLLTRGGGGSSPTDAIAAKIATRLRGHDHLSSQDASCVARKVVATMGTSRLDGVDFNATDLPAGLVPAFTAAQLDAFIACKVNIAALSPDGGSVTSTTGPFGIGGIGNIGAFLDTLASRYKSLYGLSPSQATCVATAMIDSFTNGTIPPDAFSSTYFQQFFERCHISLNDLNHSPPTT